MMKELSMHIMDITQNSVRAEAKKVILEVTENTESNIFSFSVTDDGKGMEKEFLRTVTDPFRTSRTTRKVGLGIPLLLQTCEQCGGRLTLTSEVGKGTFIKAEMEYDNIDRPPMGDIENTVYLLITMNPGVEFIYRHSYNDKQYELDMSEVMEILGGLPLDTPEVSSWLAENIKEGLTNIRQ